MEGDIGRSYGFETVCDCNPLAGREGMFLLYEFLTEVVH
jgi:hypothetical protein